MLIGNESWKWNGWSLLPGTKPQWKSNRGKTTRLSGRPEDLK
jgi:hypothetical protein